MTRQGGNWRDTARPVRLWMVSANATFPVVFSLFHLRTWTILVAIACIVALTVLEYYGFTLVVFIRYLRSMIAGKRRTATPWWM